METISQKIYDEFAFQAIRPVLSICDCDVLFKVIWVNLNIFCNLDTISNQCDKYENPLKLKEEFHSEQ